MLFVLWRNVGDAVQVEDMREENEKSPVLSEKEQAEYSAYIENRFSGLADALEQLDVRLRDIILLHYYGEKSLKEIAAAMNMSYPNMKILHKKALNQLKGLME